VPRKRSRPSILKIAAPPSKTATRRLCAIKALHRDVDDRELGTGARDGMIVADGDVHLTISAAEREAAG
jgi:hypothetical protein